MNQSSDSLGSLLDASYYAKMNENLDKRLGKESPDSQVTTTATSTTHTSRNNSPTIPDASNNITNANAISSLNSKDAAYSPRSSVTNSSSLFNDSSDSARGDLDGLSSTAVNNNHMSEAKEAELMMENKQLVDKLETLSSQIKYASLDEDLLSFILC
jgi:hypothetical protein